MFEFEKTKIRRLKGIAEFFSLLDLDNEKDLIKLLEIIDLFELDEVPLKCMTRVPQDSVFFELDKTDEKIIVDIKKTFKPLLSKKQQYDIEIEFHGISLKRIINLASKEGEALRIIPKCEKNNDIELIINDNDHNYINFSIKKYDVDNIRSQIKTILKK
jgi:hypothetical protein